MSDHDDADLDGDPEDDLAVDPQQAEPEMSAGPNMEAMHYWDDIVADMEATADEYDERGWETLQIHPGDVTVLPGETSDGERTETYGIDVLVPDNEFEDIAALVESGVAFDTYEVYKAAAGGLVLLVVAMEDTDAEAALLYPAYYRVEEPKTEMLFDRAREEGVLYSFLRRLDGRHVELRHDDPTLFEPPEEESEE